MAEPGRRGARALRRRDVLAAAAGLGLAPLFGREAPSAPTTSGNTATTAPTTSQDASAPTTLGDAAARAGRVFGSSFDTEAVDQAPYGALLRAQARILTTDYSLKFGALRDKGPTADFTDADRMIAFAAAARLPVRGHTLIWNDANPPWLAALSAPRRIYWLERHITEVMARYAGRMHSWDVVNEPFWPEGGNKGGFRGGPWYDAMGPDYVTRAFRIAATVDPGVRLVLNEAFTEAATPRGLAVRAGLLRLVDWLKAKGLRLDAVGLQAHIRPQQAFDPVGWRRFLADLAGRDVDIYLTELDVDDRIFSGSDAERDRAVAATYRAVLDVALDEPRVTTVITWQLADRYSSYRSDYGPSCRPLPFDSDLRPKPAYEAMIAAFRAHART